jgi:uncharacterized membrane protein
MNMPRIHKSIEIKAPVKNVFSYLEEPRNDPEWMTGIREVKDILGSGVGKHFKWIYKMAGLPLPLKGETEFIEDIPDKLIVIETKGSIESIWRFSLETHKDMTVLDVDIDYKISLPVLGKLAEKVLLKRNEREAGMNLMNIKERLEH